MGNKVINSLIFIAGAVFIYAAVKNKTPQAVVKEALSKTKSGGTKKAAPTTAHESVVQGMGATEIRQTPQYVRP